MGAMEGGKLPTRKFKFMSRIPGKQLNVNTIVQRRGSGYVWMVTTYLKTEVYRRGRSASLKEAKASVLKARGEVIQERMAVSGN